MKAFKKIISLIMVVTMVFGVMHDLGYRTYAADDAVVVSEVSDDGNTVTEVTPEPDEGSTDEDTTGDNTTGGDGTITRAQWLQKLVTTFGMTVEDDNYPDNYFSDLSDESEYYYDMLVAVQFGLVNIEAGGPLCPDDPVTRDFAASTLNFCLGYQLEENTEYSFSDSADCSDPYAAQIAVNLGWLTLSDGAFLPALNITAEEMELMLKFASDTLAAETLDEEHENVFEFAEGVVVVPDGTYVEYLDAETISIMNNPVEIKPGDTFAVYFEGFATTFIAKEVTVEEECTIIKFTPDEEGAGYEKVDAQGTLTPDFSLIELEEGTELLFVDEETGETFYSARDAKKTKSKKTMSISKTFEVASGVEVEVKASIIDPMVEYNFDSSDPSGVYAKLLSETEVTVEVKGSLTDALDIGSTTLFYWGIPSVGGFKVTLELEAEATVTLTSTGNLTVGVGYTKACGVRIIKSYESKSFTLEAEAKISCGLKASFGINDVPKNIIRAEIYAIVGGKASIKSTSYGDSERPFKCVHYAAYLFAEYGASGSIKFGTYTASISEKKEIFDEYNSPIKVVKHYEDGIQVCECSRGIDWNSKYKFYTRGSSAYAGCGWSGGKNSYGLNDAGEPYAIYEYELNANEEATITKYYGNMRALVIPKEIDGYVVKGIDAWVFNGNHLISSVVIPDTVEFIGDYAFGGCSVLSSVDLPEKLKTMGDHVFDGCSSLKSIEIPKSLEETGFSTFANTGLKYVKFEDGITQIVGGLFSDCVYIREITIPDTVLTIEGSAFERCISLRTIDFSDSVTHIGNNAFGGCISLEEIVIPDSVRVIEPYAFNGCSAISNVVLSKKLETIGECTFTGCDMLTSIEIPKSLKDIDTWGGNGPFAYNSALKNITFEDGITNILGRLFVNCTGLEKIEIPDTVLTIGEAAFDNCDSLKDVNLPESLSFIGHGAFRNCDALESITIPDSVTKMDGDVFSNCLNLSDVKLSKNLVDIGYNVFNNCDALTAITIPKSLKTVNGGRDLYGVFEYCDNLKEVKFEEGITSIPNCLFVRCTGLEKIEIPDTVESIEYRAFAYAGNLKEVVIPDSVKTIRDSAFVECDSLEKIVIPDSVTTIEYEAFNNCDKLTDVTLSNNLTTIASNLFANSKALKNITIPDNVTVLENGAFYNCTALEKVELSRNLKLIENSAFQNCESLSDIVLPDGLETIEYRAFANCDALSKIVIPDSVTSIGNSLFSDTELLTDVTIGTGITKIPSYCFSNSASLEQITLPYTITAIESDAFKECAKLTNIFIPRATASIGNNVFSYPSKLTISGVAGTYAETYANEQGIKFENKEVKATEVSLGETTLSVSRGQIFKLPLVVTPADFTDTVTWRSTDINVIYVGENGELEARSVGTATVKVTVGDVSAAVKITVEQPVECIYLNVDEVSLEAFGSFQLYADVDPDEALDQSVTWSSSDEKVVTVDENGFVKAVGKGTATVTVTSNSISTVYAVCEFTVLNNGYDANALPTFESTHNYENNCSDVWRYVIDDAENLELTFANETNIEEGFDFLYIYDAEYEEVGKFTGIELAGKKIVVSGNTAYIKLVSDEAGTEWGFKVASITPYVGDVDVNVDGDVDGDGFVSASDALLILKKAAGLIELDETQAIVAEMDKDGFISASDALIVLKIAAGLL